ncbi:MAG TPA: bifunctional precorrin-2 dehydrogenase/sirohydrochlorin ferrochelatase [Ktedonobacteraceae bacterium]|nr:bifunctional precorrin-2 dehydrogenase/sirohydrochlorin ferrochelatase [Ktedonobacteraceae bacterium]
MPNYYPIMLDVRGRPALVIGGNDVAAEKAAALSASGAQVTVQNAKFCPELLALAEQGAITLRQKAYAAGDLAGAFVVVAATTYDPQLSEAIWNEAQERGQLVNIVDVPTRCNFIVPSILRRGKLTISVSTEGASPSLSKRIRQRLEGLFPAAYDSYIQLAVVARTHLRQHGISYAQRDAFFGEYYSSEILKLLAEDNAPQALARTTELLGRYGVTISTETILDDLTAIA